MSYPKLFISHSTHDATIANAFVKFMVESGIPYESILCSSAPGTQFATGSSLFGEIRNALNNDNVFVVYLLSENYYNSVICLNEMGAAWIKRAEGQVFILPGFSFEAVQGVIKADETLGISLSPIDKMTKGRLSEFRNRLSEWFKISISPETWEIARDDFFVAVEAYNAQIQSPSIDMNRCNSFCIDDDENDGCHIETQFSSSEKTTVTVDFSQTNANLCSVVYYSRNSDWTGFLHQKKCLNFSISSNSETPAFVEVEAHLKYNFKVPKLLVTQDRVPYSIPLTCFSDAPEDWTETREICFVFHRRDVSQKTQFIIESVSLC